MSGSKGSRHRNRSSAEEVEESRTATSVEDLLSQPFEEALRRCDALRKYIDEGEDAIAVKEEFRESWHSEAPAGLRQVLEEILDPAAAAANNAETEAFLKDPSRAFPTVGAPDGGVPLSRPVDREEPEGHALEGREHLLARAQGREEELLRLQESGEESKIDDMLGRPFEEVFSECSELRNYIRSREDAGDLEQEFRDHWHPDAPPELRQVLQELLYPLVAAASASEQESFKEGMSSFLQRHGHTDLPAKQPRARL